MAEAAAAQQWNHTSILLAMTANCHRDPKKSRAFCPADFNPYTQLSERDEIAVTKETIGDMRNAFLGKGVEK